MFSNVLDILKSFWGRSVGFIIIACIAFSCSSKSNIEKFNSIDIDLAAAGINKTALLEEFKKDPLACRKEVEHHRRKRFLFVTREHEQAIGKQFVSAMQKMDILWQDSKGNARCNAILSKLTKVLPEHFTAPEKIYILDTPEINACCLPDGTIIVFRGLLEKFNDDELAWVIAHELGHGIAHHSAEMLSKSMVQELAIDAFLDEESGLFKTAGTYIAAFITNLKYSRAQENEADRLALLYMNKACFNMQGAVSALNKLELETGRNSKWAEWLSTHPKPEKRLKNVKKAIEQLQKNPDHKWGTPKDDLLEIGKVKAIKYYMNKNKLK